MTVKEYPLVGIKTLDLNLLPDERGFFSEALRQDWNEIIEELMVQANLSFTYPGTVRAWHRHLRGQVDVLLVLGGTLKICAYDEVSGKLAEVIASDRKPMLVSIPGHYWHGFKAIAASASGGALLMYFVNRLYDPKDPDEERRPWNDREIVPTEINGNTNDPRVGQPWDWLYPPHK
ncbi:dTDP-4-dehydrorhamnose 3,5-epimerase family protein [Chloroflexota bacterium]